MKLDEIISTRLGGKNFFKTSYYKFEKCNQLKQKYLKEKKLPLINFGIGESDQMPDLTILDELTKQSYVYENRIYADNGIDAFKIAAKKHLKAIYNVDCEKKHLKINHVMGAKSGLVIIPFSFISPGDYVIYTTPGYQVLPTIAQWLQAKLYEVPLLEENNYLPDLEAIPEEIYKKAKIFLVNYPNSPTGAIANVAFYRKLIKKALTYHFLIVNDCVYGPLTYHQKPLSIFNLAKSEKCCIEVHSLSKAFHMTGFRIGFVVANAALIHILKEIKDNMDSGQYIPIQYAAIKAYENEKNIIEKNKAFFYDRLLKVSQILNRYHLTCKVPEATFYLYVKAPKNFKTGEEFFLYLLNEGGIYTIPWDEVGPYVRFAMTYHIEENEEIFYQTLENRLKLLTKIKDNDNN